MKRLAFLILVLLMLTGCTPQDPQLHFYYRQKELVYGAADGVIAMEPREAPGHEDDLDYLLTLYLEGPLDDTLVSPFPQGTAMEGFTYSDATMYVTLNDVYASLDGMDHTIASACIAHTCFDLTKAEKVVIKCTSSEYGNKSITLTRDALLLTDDSTATASTEPTQ